MCFEIDHVPEEFDYRDSQMKELAFAVKPGMDGGRPLKRNPPGDSRYGENDGCKADF